MGCRKQQGWGRQGPPLELPTHRLKAYPRSHLLCVPCAFMSYRQCRARWGLSLCPQTVFIQRLSQSRGSGDIHRQLPCNHRTETSRPGPRGRGRRYSALWNHSSEPSFQLGTAPWKDRLCYVLVSVRGDKKTCRRQTEPTPAESLDGRSILGEAGTLHLYNSLCNGYSPQYTGGEVEACRFQGGEEGQDPNLQCIWKPKDLSTGLSWLSRAIKLKNE